MNKLKKDKRGVIGIILFFVVLFLILIIGFIGAMAIGIIDLATDTLMPLTDEFGIVEGNNVTQAAEFTLNPVNTFVQALPWIVGFGYVTALIFSIVFVVFYNYNPHPAFIGIYFMLMILLIFGSIIMSNMYQDIYSMNDEIGTRLQEQTLLSYMILYSPFIFTIIGFVAGIYLFAVNKDNSGGYPGI